jgi:ADP-ribose pyrophosphatase
MPPPLPWTVLRERSRKDFHIFHTRTLDVADPRDGKPYVRTVIEAPDWVNVVPITADDKVILVRQFRFGTWSNTLELPGGMVDPHESPAQAAPRELEEETGYRAATVSLLGVSHPNPAIFGNRLHSFLATGCVRVHAGKQDGSEDIAVELATRDELKQLVREGVVTHALVLAALLYEAWR